MEEVLKIDLLKLAELFQPWERNIWVECNKPISSIEIEESLYNNQTQGPHIPVKFELIWDISDRTTHIKRIAWLVNNFSDDFPIEIDFGIPNTCYPTIIDGNHRLLAAYFLKRSFIMVNWCGAISEVKKYTYHGHNTTTFA